MKPFSEKKITINDIARQAKVSKATVSRVINNRPYVRDSLRKRVLGIIKRADYQVNLLAKGLSSQVLNTVGVVFPEIDTGFFSELLKSLNEESTRKNIFLLISFAKKKERAEIIKRLLSSKLVKNLILLAPDIEEKDIEKFKGLYSKIILIGNRMRGENILSVNVKNEEKSYEIVSHLISHGYRKIAMIAGPDRNFEAKERLKGYKKALQDGKIPFDKRLVEKGNFTEEGGYSAIKKIFENGNLPEAVFCGNDAMAIGAMEYLKENKIKVPEEIAVCGFDGIRMGEYFGLTTVKVPFEKIGRYAISLLFEEEKVKDVLLDCEIVVRESCGCKRG